MAKFVRLVLKVKSTYFTGRTIFLYQGRRTAAEAIACNALKEHTYIPY